MSTVLGQKNFYYLIVLISISKDLTASQTAIAGHLALSLHLELHLKLMNCVSNRNFLKLLTLFLVCVPTIWMFNHVSLVHWCLRCLVGGQCAKFPLWTSASVYCSIYYTIQALHSVIGFRVEIWSLNIVRLSSYKYSLEEDGGRWIAGNLRSFNRSGY